MTLMEECCRKIINQKLSNWLTIKHAKILTSLKKHEKMQLGEILLLHSEKENTLQCLKDLRQAKLIEYDGLNYQMQNELESLQKLMQMTEKQEARIIAKSR